LLDKDKAAALPQPCHCLTTIHFPTPRLPNRALLFTIKEGTGSTARAQGRGGAEKRALLPRATAPSAPCAEAHNNICKCKGDKLVNVGLKLGTKKDVDTHLMREEYDFSLAI